MPFKRDNGRLNIREEEELIQVVLNGELDDIMNAVHDLLKERKFLKAKIVDLKRDLEAEYILDDELKAMINADR